MEKEHLEEQQGNNTAEENLTDKSEESEKVAEETVENVKDTDEISEEIPELDQTKADLAEAKDKYLRLYSEFSQEDCQRKAKSDRHRQ